MDEQKVNILAGYEPAPLEDWYRYNYFNNEIDISGSGVEEYSFQEIKEIAGFSFDELDSRKAKDGETVGGLAIRVQLASMFGTGDPGMVMVTNGANEALQLVARSILEPGDEVITLGPCYHCHDKIASSMGCKVKKWELSLDEDFDLDLLALREALTTSTKAIFLNFPHNPTGKSISQEMLNEILSIVRDGDIYLVWDAVFQQLIYEDRELRDPIHDYHKTITVGTFSKAFGAPGLRFGWIIAPQNVLSACVRQKDYGNLYVAPITEFMAEKMLMAREKFFGPRLAQAAHNRQMVSEWIDSKDLRISWRKPDGGVCGVIRLPQGVDDVAFCVGLLNQYGVLLVPGSCFGMPSFVRLGFGGAKADLKEGLARLEEYVLRGR